MIFSYVQLPGAAGSRTVLDFELLAADGRLFV